MLKKMMLVFLAPLAAACGGNGGEDRCRGVSCKEPPANVCKDANTIVKYAAEGICQQETGRCLYSSQENNCPQGCHDGRCMGEDHAEGFIFVHQTKGAWGNYSGAKAYFAEQLHRRKLPGFLETRLLNEQQRDGDCAFYLPPQGRSLRYDPCYPPCGGDTYCGGNGCVSYPPHWNAGPIQFSGLKHQLIIHPDQYDNYLADELPVDLFAAGADITAAAAGGELAAFRMQARGVPSLQTGAAVLRLAKGKNLAVDWTPADPGSRVQLFLRAGIHWPALPVALVCDAPDSQGRITISASLVDAFLDSAFVIQHMSDLMRYRNEIKTPFGKPIEFRVASVVELGLELP